MKAPLQGLRVLDLSRLLPGPFCTLILSDLGARVDKVEDPTLGDYLRLFPPTRRGLSGRFIAINRDKRSLCLDLKRPEGREVLLRLARSYDVVVESFRPGVMDRLGVGWSSLSAVNPKLVLLSISGYGQTGPYRNRAGHDLNYESLAGVTAMAGSPSMTPPVPGVQLADVAGGALWGAVVGILAALLGVSKTGEGRHVDVSMCEGALAFMLPDLGNFDLTGKPPRRGEELLNGGAACYAIYRTRDGRHLSVGALEPKFWIAFNQTIGRAPDPSELVAPPAEQERIRAEIQAILEGKTRDEWEEIFSGADACVEPVLGADELERHPQHAARDLFFRMGEDLQVWTPTAHDRSARPGPDRGPPSLGRDSALVLAEAGFSDDEIGRLRADSTIR